MDPVFSALSTHFSTLVAREEPDKLIVGLSGGLDSVVLLHGLTQLSRSGEVDLPSIEAVYVNHGLSAHADDWQQFCAALCKKLNVSFTAIAVEVTPRARESLEACARDRRYEALCDHAKSARRIIVTAHHQNDQLETLLLQLKRGAGPKGLSGIPAFSVMHSVPVSRPLLPLSRAQILAYAQQHDLSWIEDESNADESFDRNFLRRSVLPPLLARWPSFSQTASRSASLCAEQQGLLDEVCDERLQGLCDRPECISVSGLNAVSPAWQRALLRRWLELNRVAMPGTRQLTQIQQMLTARPDAQPHVVLGNIQLRRYQDVLYCLDAEQQPWFFKTVGFNTQEYVAIEPLRQQLMVGKQQEGALCSVSVAAAECHFSLSQPVLSLPVKPAGEAHHKPLKQWFKQWQVPPWERSDWLLLSDRELPLALVGKGRIIALSATGPKHFIVQLFAL
ncbi:MAG: tRNA lysidine(34) synthetase TilS [Gammaproteobacteria bacterium]|nr:tRNA lysidine(34) synthetase TilS [Gammaproteobacteria bacterium]